MSEKKGTYYEIEQLDKRISKLEKVLEESQLIDDKKGVTLASASSLEKSIKEKKLSKKDLAELIGKNIAKKIISIGIDKVAFDRGKYKYHGLIKILAEAARSEGLNF